MSVAIKVDHVCKKYGDNIIIPDLTANIKNGEFFTLLGPSGCGKTTLLRMIAGFNSIEAGTISFGDQVINELPTHQRNIGMVFQSYAIFPHLTVRQNVEYGLKIRKLPRDEMKKRVDEMLKLVRIDEYQDRLPERLSGGQQQRVALARAIVIHPQVLLMDEPLSNLDAKLRVQMRTEITKLHQRLQTTFIYVTHDQTEAMTMGTRIVVMKDGFIQQVDTPQNLYDYPANLFVGSFIGRPQMNFFDAKLVKRVDGVWAEFGNNAIKVPDAKVRKLVDESYIGKEVVMGIRPENIHDEERFLSAADNNLVEAKVEVVELMGSETYLYLKVDGKDSNVVARVDPRSTSRTGDTVKVAFETNRLHFFDKDTELSILNR